MAAVLYLLINKTEKAFSPNDCAMNDKSNMYILSHYCLPDNYLTTAWPLIYNFLKTED